MMTTKAPAGDARSDSLFLPQVIVLNGTSSSGKTALAQRLQDLLPEIYLNFSVDAVLYSVPPSDLQTMRQGWQITRAGYSLSRMIRGYHAAAAALVRAGNRVIIDNATTREGWREDMFQNLAGFSVFWIGVVCDLAVAQAREKARGDRAIGTAEREAPVVHRGFTYDLEIDTTAISPDAAAKRVVRALAQT
jgi:chloramphenicol 3-O phosphotransferase